MIEVKQVQVACEFPWLVLTDGQVVGRFDSEAAAKQAASVFGKEETACAE